MIRNVPNVLFSYRGSGVTTTWENPVVVGRVGMGVGTPVGAAVGVSVGFGVGSAVGRGVGARPYSQVMSAWS